MKNVFKPGDSKEYTRVIAASDVASFDGKNVHPVYATFSLARDAEWTSRQFVLEMKEETEEGIGTLIHIEHKGPAFVAEEIKFIATVEQLEGNHLICTFEARVGQRLIATGKTGQKVLSKAALAKILSRT